MIVSRNKNDGSIFAQRLRKERYRTDAKGHPVYDSTEEFAKKIRVSRQTLGFWLNDKRTPDMDGLVKVSKALNMSIDYLVGLSNTNSLDVDIQAVSRMTGLSEEAIKAINNKNFRGMMPDFLNSFVEYPGFMEFAMLFGAAWNDATYKTDRIYHDDADGIPVSSDKKRDQVMMRCMLLGHSFTNYLMSYFVKLSDAMDAVETVDDESEAK